MPRSKISEYSATANSNTDVAGINVDEGCAPSGINNAIRAVMGHLKDFQAGTNSDSFNGPTNGAHNGSVGATTPAAGTFTTLSATGNVTLGDASTDTLNVGNGGIVKDASGNVGIGTASPGERLTIQTALTGTTAGSNTVGRFQSNGNGYDANIAFGDNVNASARIGYLSGAQYFWTNGAERMRIDSSGNVGIGTISPNAKLHVNNGSSGGASSYFTDSTTGTSSGFQVGLDSGHNAILNMQYNAQMLFSTNNTERARIDSSGNLLVGKTSTGDFVTGIEMQPAGAVLSYRNNGVAGIFGRTTSGETVRFTNNGATVGNISTTGSATAYNTSSDYRLKNSVAPMTGALAKVATLKPVTYKWNADGSESEGFIAHELQAVVPDCVTGEKDAVDADGNPVYQGIDTSFLVATLTAAIQEQQTLITTLTERISALEAK